MPKMKTKKNARKRLRVTKSGKIKCYRAGRRHLLTSKRGKRKRYLGKPTYLAKGDEKVVKLMLPYGA